MKSKVIAILAGTALMAAAFSAFGSSNNSTDSNCCSAESYPTECCDWLSCCSKEAE
ncbi:MAG: hypothetical protein GY810_07355 [Aureispira sp.]|nr:hypothetical protein [Aureispira sp.]